MHNLDHFVICAKFGEYRWRGIPAVFGGATLELHNSVIRHDPRCDGNCEATRDVERLRAENRLIGKPRHCVRAAT